MNLKIRKDKGSKAFRQDQKIRNKRQHHQQKDDIDRPKLSEIINGTGTEEIQEKRLQKEYESIEQKPAFMDGNLTNAYLEWKELRSKFMYLEELGMRLGKQEDQGRSKSKKEMKEELLNKFALQLSKVFLYHELKAAASGEGGFAVHGWLQVHAPNDYEELIDSYVLDRACYYAKKHYSPEVLKFVRELDLNALEMTRLQLKRDYKLKNFPGITYQQVIIFANGKLENALTWIPNYLKEFEGSRVPVNYAPANIGMIGLPIWDVLQCVVLHAPGKNQAFLDAKIEAKDIVNSQDNIQKKVIHQIRGGQEPIEDQLDQASRQYLQMKKERDWLLAKIETMVPSDIIAEYDKKEKIASKTKTKVNWRMLIGFIILIVIAGGVISLFMFLGNGGMMQGPTNSTG